MLCQPSTLWAIEGLPATAVGPADDFGTALQQHLTLAGQGITTTVMQIGPHQRSYVRLNGCGSCEHGRCTPGCRVRLFERVLKAGWSTTSLRHIDQGKDTGLASRPYTRVYIGIPRHDARPLDAALLHPWREARLTLTWTHGAMPVPRQTSVLANRPTLIERRPVVGAVLVLGKDGPDDPQLVFGTRGWHFVRAGKAESLLLQWYGARTIRDARVRLGVPTTLAPHLLVATSRDVEHDPVPDIPEPARRPLAEDVIAHGHATMIARELQELGARVEFLDLHPDGWTATLAAIHPAGMAQFLTDVHADHPAFFVKDADAATIALRNTATMAPGMLPPVLKLGTLRESLARYRPISRTHHLIIAGPELPGVLAGLAAPLVDGRSDVRLGILDVADGTIARQLSGVPRRLPTVRADDEQELLGVLGTISGSGVPVMVIVYATDPVRCHKALIPLMRASAYLNLSLVMATPTEENLPELILQRVPILRIQDRQAHWDSPYGVYHEWGRKTPLRLPHRDPTAPWALPDEATFPTLVSTDAYWLLPDHLTETLIPGYAPQRADAERGAEKAANSADMGGEPAREASDQASTATDDTGTAPKDRGAEENLKQVREPIRFDNQRSVVVDDDMIGYVLHQINTSHGQPTVSVKQLRELFKLEKVPAIQILEALKSRQIITGEPRDGHYTYETVDAAMANNHLAAGAWSAAPAGTTETESSSSAIQTGDVEQGIVSPVGSDAATTTTGSELCSETATQPAQIPASVCSAGEVVSGDGFWQVTGIAASTTAFPHGGPVAIGADWTPEFELEAEAVPTPGGDGTNERVLHDHADGREPGPVQQNGEVFQ